MTEVATATRRVRRRSASEQAEGTFRLTRASGLALGVSMLWFSILVLIPLIAVIVTASEEDANLFEAIKSGAKGYLMKDLKADVFFALLDGVENDQPALTPALARKLLQELSHPHAKPRSEDPDALTEREQEVLELLVQGVTSNKKLADRLEVSENTIKFHMRNILEKLHLHNRAEVIAFAARRGFVPPETPHK